MRDRSSEDTVPPLVRRYLERALSGDDRVPERVRVTQVGQMWPKPGGRPRSFRATEELAVREVAFFWRARFPLRPFASLHVLDEYEGGEGKLEARLLGLVPVMRRRGPELSLGEALRYLAELPWVPYAMRLSRRLEWRDLGSSAVEVATRVGMTAAAVRFDFDPSGDIAGVFCDQRPRPESGNRPTPWGGTFADYEVVGGVRIPTRADVRWELPAGPFTYWSGRVTSLEIV